MTGGQGIITVEQLKHHRSIASKISDTHRIWTDRFAWFPVEQRRLYKRVDEIHKESRSRYGDKIFLDYARERKLNKRFTTTESEKRAQEEEVKATEYLANYTYSVTTNGEYGRIKPSKMYFC